MEKDLVFCKIANFATTDILWSEVREAAWWKRMSQSNFVRRALADAVIATGSKVPKDVLAPIAVRGKKPKEKGGGNG